MVVAYHSTQHMFTGSPMANRSTVYRVHKDNISIYKSFESYTDQRLLFTKFQLLFETMVCYKLGVDC